MREQIELLEHHADFIGAHGVDLLDSSLVELGAFDGHDAPFLVPLKPD